MDRVPDLSDWKLAPQSPKEKLGSTLRDIISEIKLKQAARIAKFREKDNANETAKELLSRLPITGRQAAQILWAMASDEYEFVILSTSDKLYQKKYRSEPDDKSAFLEEITQSEWNGGLDRISRLPPMDVKTWAQDETITAANRDEGLFFVVQKENLDIIITKSWG